MSVLILNCCFYVVVFLGPMFYGRFGEANLFASLFYFERLNSEGVFPVHFLNALKNAADDE